MIAISYNMLPPPLSPKKLKVNVYAWLVLSGSGVAVIGFFVQCEQLSIIPIVQTLIINFFIIIFSSRYGHPAWHENRVQSMIFLYNS
jgi:hypothetical protein